jgi:predicted amidohydrolase
MAETGFAAANIKVVHDKATNLRRFLELIEEAASQKVGLLVLPEMGLQGYADFAFSQGTKGQAAQKQYYEREAETIPGPSTEIIRRAVERHGMYVQVGMAESALNGNTIYNSTALVGPGGVVSVYRKTHNPFEWPYFNPGQETPVADLPWGRAAAAICYDLCFPELIRAFALKGADLILVSTAWPMTAHDRNDDYSGWAMDLALTANAFFNQMWIVVSNHCEKKAYSEKLDYYGGTQIVDPFGKVVAYLTDGEGLVVHRADIHRTIIEARTTAFWGNNFLQDRRPELYGNLVDESHRHPSQARLAARGTDNSNGAVDFSEMDGRAAEGRHSVRSARGSS